MSHAGDPLSLDYTVASAQDLVAVVPRLRASLADRPEEWENLTQHDPMDARSVAVRLGDRSDAHRKVSSGDRGPGGAVDHCSMRIRVRLER